MVLANPTYLFVPASWVGCAPTWDFCSYLHISTYFFTPANIHIFVHTCTYPHICSYLHPGLAVRQHEIWTCIWLVSNHRYVAGIINYILRINQTKQNTSTQTENYWCNGRHQSYQGDLLFWSLFLPLFWRCLAVVFALTCSAALIKRATKPLWYKEPYSLIQRVTKPLWYKEPHSLIQRVTKPWPALPLFNKEAQSLFDTKSHTLWY